MSRLREKARLALVGDLVLGDLAERIAAAYSDAVLVEEPGGERWSAERIATTVDAWAARVTESSAPGDHVVVRLPNGFPFVLACLAIARAGRIVVPVNDRMQPSEVDHVVADSGATLTIDSAQWLRSTGSRRRVAPYAASRPSVDDVAAVFYTSGTTGRPKGAELTHRGLLGSLRRAALVPTGFRDDEAVFALPMAHIMGFVGIAGLLLSGVRIHALPKFDALAVLDAIEQRRASMFIGVPAMYRMLLDAGAADRDLKSIRVWLSGADAMPPDLARTFQRFGASATLPGFGTHVGEAMFVEGYGMVELSGGVAYKVSPPYAGGLLTRPIGAPLRPNRLRVVDPSGRVVAFGRVGELEVRGPGVLKGYHGDEGATTAAITSDGWLRTGDLARRLPFGAIEFAGRSKDVIKVGGYSVFAAEVQAVLEQAPGVAEAAVVGLADDRLGEVPGAALRPERGAALLIADVEAFAAERLAPYKVPRRWVIVSEVPRTATEKVQRDRVRALLDKDG